MRGHLFFNAGKVSQDIYVVHRQGKVESQFARISRLRKFVISKSQNPKI